MHKKERTEQPRPAASLINPELPPQSHLEERLHSQRLSLVRMFSAGLVIFSGVACPAYLAVAARSSHIGILAVGFHTGLIAAGGILALYFCHGGRLREATYTIALPLISQATMVLALLADSEGIAVISYCLVVSIAALTLEGRDWPRLALCIGFCTIIGTLLHSFPVVDQGHVPTWLAAGSMIVIMPLGLLLPMTLFWLFSTHLTASRAQAWELARTTARANHVKTEFLSTMSHELRSPMHVIIGNVQMLREGAYGEVTAEQDHTLKRMETYSIELLQLIESALHVSRLESGRMPVSFERFALPEVIEEVMETAAVAAHTTGVELRARSTAPDHLVTDRLKLKEILQNLVTNAIKFTRSGHVEIRVFRDDSDTVFEVEDTGVGIPAEDLPLIFDSFRQLQNSETEWLRGVGLGLYIVKRLVALLGGTVSVESALGRGSTFRVRLPAPPTAAAPGLPSGEAEEEAPAHPMVAASTVAA